MPISNSENQERYRKKEELKKYANQVFFEWQLRSLGNNHVNPQDIKTKLDNLASLPSKWTEADYKRAWKSISQILLDSYDNPHLLSNDINDARDLRTATNEELHLFFPKIKEAEKNAKKLVSHIQSLFSLMNTDISDQAAVLAELMRITGRRLLDEKIIPKTNANTECLASIGSQFDRPKWFIKNFTELLIEHLDTQLADSLARNIIECIEK